MKKILSALLSVAMIAGSFVAVQAVDYTGTYGTDPSFRFDAVELTKETYETVMMEDLPEGTTPYQINIDFINLPDLTWARNSGGERLGSISLKMFCDITKIKRLQVMGIDQQLEEWGAEQYGYLKIAQDNVTLNALDNTITVAKGISAAGDAFPYLTGDATKDVEGVLDDAIVLYAAVEGSVTITDIYSQIYINHGGLDNTDMYTIAKVKSGYVIGGTEGGEGEVTLVAGVDEITTEGRHQGKASFSASTGVATTGLTKITVENSVETGRVETWDAPLTLGEGITKVLPIVTYNKVAELIDSIFTVKFYNADGVFKTLTYKVQ